MSYDPFARGPFAVEVRSGQLSDAARGARHLPFEVWYPAVGGERRPLVLYSHSSADHRRQSSFLCTHLASHGYIVAAVDHTGNTAADFVAATERTAAGAVLTPAERAAQLARIIADRVPDLRFLLDSVIAGAAGELSDQVDTQRIGLVGWSFGGWAVLSVLEGDERVGAVVALAPAGNSKPLPGIIPATLTFAWKREVPILFLVAERDRFTPLAGQYELFDCTPSSKRMFILRYADHQHFGDDVGDAGLVPPELAHLFTRGLTLAHLDAVFRDADAARRFIEHDALAALREHGVDAFAHLEAAGRPN